MMRSSTLTTLLSYHTSPDKTLGKALQVSLDEDPVKAVLLDTHYEAVDRRVAIILQVMRECLGESDNITDVIFSHDDLYNSGYDAVENEKAFN
jgi:hypothetical protein